MNLIRRSPSVFRDDLFFPIEQQFDKFFSEFFKSANIDSVVSTVGYPKLDVFEEDGNWVVKAAVPGVNSEDISVEIIPNGENSTLQISGKMSEEHHAKNDSHYYVRELKKSSFQRQIKLPLWVKEDPDATFKDGILKLIWKLPDKKEAVIESRKIEIKKED